uniref:Uncharacterized protein n=1 Tax=Vitis vinifera TaxID=29760 RepID=A5C095_VITVI|nr:hypothetical protein VITISV_013621 [Vitis vinifera]
MHQAPQDESLDSTCLSSKRQHDKRPQLSDAMHARLGSQEPGKTKPPVATTWETYPDPLVAPVVQNNLPPQVVRQAGRNSSNEPPTGSISKRLDDMLSTPFCSHIIHYDPLRGFLMPKFSASSNEAYAQAPHSLNHSLKSLPRQWMICSSKRANTQCWKMMCVQPPNKFWLLDRHPEAMQKGVPNFRTGQDARVRDTPRNRDSGTPRTLIAPKAIINYIHGGPLDEEYNSKRKRQKLLRDASVRERINTIRPGVTDGSVQPINGTIVFPPVDPTRILQLHRDALILSLEMGDFDVRRILTVDPQFCPFSTCL